MTPIRNPPTRSSVVTPGFLSIRVNTPLLVEQRRDGRRAGGEEQTDAAFRQEQRRRPRLVAGCSDGRAPLACREVMAHDHEHQVAEIIRHLL